MAYRQYTECVEIENFTHLADGIWNGIIQAAVIGLYVTIGAAAAVALLAEAVAVAAEPLCLIILAAVYVTAAIVGFCYWWLYLRLICIPAPPDHPADSAGDHFAIGLLINIELPSSRAWYDLDNDYSIGILPCPNPLGANDHTVETSQPFGYLVDGRQWARDHGLPYAGEHASDTPDDKHCVDTINSEVLHCEFEGRGMYDMLIAAQAALFLAIAALVTCFVLPLLGPLAFIGAWLMAILLVLWFGMLIAGFVFGRLDHDDGDPSDVNSNLTELQLNDCEHNGAYTLVIRGHWVYDSFHTGALELHPVTFACLDVCPEDPGDVILIRKRWQAAIDDATSPATVENQKQPENLWQVHPIIDGCQPPIIV